MGDGVARREPLFRRVAAGALGLTLGAAGLGLVAAPPAGAEPATGTVATVTVGAYPSAVAIASTGTKAFVANSRDATTYTTTSTSNGTVSVINTTATPPAVTATVTVKHDPEALAVRPGTQQLYVVNSGSSSISILNLAVSPPSVLKTVSTDSGFLKPDAIAFTSTGAYAYVPSGNSGTLDVINCTTQAVVAEVDLGSSLHGIAISPDNSRAYIADPGAGNLVVVNLGTPTAPVVASMVSTTGTGHGVGFVPDPSHPATAHTLYMTNVGNHTVTAFDTSTTPPAATGTVPLGQEAWNVAFTPDGQRAYVALPGPSQLAVLDSTITPPAVLGHDGGLHDPSGMAVTPDGQWVYATNRTSTGTVTVFPNVVPPVITSVGPQLGPVGGGNTVTITGHGLSGATSVLFGTAPGTIVTNTTDTALTVTVPAGSGTVPVVVKNGAAQSTPVDYSYSLGVTTATLPVAETGVTYATTLAAAGGTQPYTWSVATGTLPTGVTLDPSSGVVSGTPTAAGTQTFTVQVADSATPPVTATAPLAIEVRSPVAVTTPATLPRAAAGIPYSTTLATSGGQAPFAWSVIAGTLPTGLSLNGSTGVISGTPAPGTGGQQTFTVGVTDTLGGGATKALAVDTFGIASVSLPQGEVGASYTASYTATGGTTPYTWSITAGALPAGLTLDPATGAVTGTPTTAGTATFSVAVTDSSTPPVTVSEPASLTIDAAGPPTVTGLSPALGQSSGGTTVAIDGTALAHVTAVTFGSTPGATVTVVSDTEVTAVAPAGSGTVDVTVTNPDGTSPTSPDVQFTYTTWPTITLANPSGPQRRLYGVSCPAVGNCVAVGGTTTQTSSAFVETSGTWLPATLPPATGGALYAVSCPAVTDCVAVGRSSSTYTYRQLVESLATGTWTAQVLPNLSSSDALFSLTAVSCPSTTRCVAVGSYYGRGNVSYPLAEILTPTPGGGWQATPVTPVMPSGATRGLGAMLYGISCPSVTTCVAVGGWSNRTGTTVSLIENLAYTGTTPKWTLADTSRLAGDGLFGVSCADIGDCVAVGYFGAAQLAGGNWNDTPAPAFGASLFGVSCPTANDCVASGWSYGSGASYGTVETFANGQWQGVQLTSQRNGTGRNIDCLSTIDCVVAGLAQSVSESLPVASLPVVTGVSPRTGSTTGGTAVTVSGGGFTGAIGVMFGAAPATSFTVNWDGQLTATAPPGSTGTVDITVTGPGGTSATSSADSFNYGRPATVTGITPTTGPATGGTTVVVHGSNFTQASAVRFGPNAAPSFTVDTDTQLTATAPPGTSGTVDLTVITPAGPSATSSADQFTYTAVVTAFSITVNGSATSASTPYGSAATLAAVGLPASATGTVTFTQATRTMCQTTLPATNCQVPSTLQIGLYPGITGSFVNTDGSYGDSTSSNTVDLAVTAATLTAPYLYVSSGTDGSLHPVDTTTKAVGSPIGIGGGPGPVIVTPDGQTVYASRGTTGKVVPIATAAGAAGTPVSVGGWPTAMATSPDGQTGWVVTYGNNMLVPFSLATGAVGTPIPVGSTPWSVAITPQGTTAYVVRQHGYTTPGDVLPVTLSTGLVGTPIVVGDLPEDIAITPDGTMAYVTNGTSASVTPIVLATGTPGTPISVASTPTEIVITPDGKKAYVGSWNAVTPITLTTGTAQSQIRVSNNPDYVVMSPDGKTVYVYTVNGSKITPITVATNTAGTGITIGAYYLYGAAITPDQAPVAALSVTPAAAGQPSSFDASASTVTFGTITTYAWTFGDGTSATTSTPTTTHTYFSPGDYPASVTETDSAGTSTTVVFTGQSVLRNGGPSAVAAQTVDVPGVATTFSITVDGGTSATVGGGTPATLAEAGLPATAAGAVTFATGTTVLCTAILPATSCTSAPDLPAGVYPTIVGTYDPFAGPYDGSTSSNAVSLTVLTTVSPTTGTQGTVVTITGSDLTGASAVHFGTVPATGVTVVSTTTLTAVAPAGTGTVDVTVTTIGGTSSVTAADQFTYVAGPAVAAGDNTYGELGNGTKTGSTIPLAVHSLTSATAVAVGTYHSLALATTGQVYAWGQNAYGQLGNGSTTTATTPVEVAGPGGAGYLSAVVAVAAGGNHSMALTATGHVYAWGQNTYGQLGNGSTTKSTTPVEVTGPGGTGALSDVVAIAAGLYHSMALTATGQVFTWGYGANGQLGNGTTANSAIPVQVDGVSNAGQLTGIVAIAAGNLHSVALTASGQVVAWGYNGFGQLGNAKTAASTNPVQVKGVGGTGTLTGIVAITAGANHTVALTQGGTVDAWGTDAYGQLGNGSTTKSTTPIVVTGLSSIRSVDAGGNNTAAITTTGQLYTWGTGAAGQLANGSTAGSTTPIAVALATITGGVAFGGSHLLGEGTPIAPR